MKYFTILLITLFTFAARSYTVPTYRDLKPATQVMLEHQDFGTPNVGSDNKMLTAVSGPTSAAAYTITTFDRQPDVPRALTVVPKGTTGDVEACSILVKGTNFYGKPIEETLNITADQTGLTAGNKAFRTVTSIYFPPNCESGGFAATWDIYTNNKLGISKCLPSPGYWAWGVHGTVYQNSRANVTTHPTQVELNTAAFGFTYDGTTRATGLYIQNFACRP